MADVWQPIPDHELKIQLSSLESGMFHSGRGTVNYRHKKPEDLLAQLETTDLSEFTQPVILQRSKNSWESFRPLFTSLVLPFLGCSCLCPRLCNAENCCTEKKKKSVRKKKASSLHFPWFSPWRCGIPCLLCFPTECSKAPFFSARCVDSVTDAYPFSCRPLCVFKQLENTSVLTEIVTIIKHHQPHRFSLFVFYLTFFYWNLSKVWLWTSNLYTQSNSKYKHNTGILQ